jgi:hypothetical protein
MPAAEFIQRPSFVHADRPWPPQPREQAARSADACTNNGLQVTGHLTQRAELRVCAGGTSAVLELHIDTGSGYPVIARQLVSGDPAAQRAAASKAAALDRGVLVRAYARGCVARTDHGVAALFLLDVTDVIPCNLET